MHFLPHRKHLPSQFYTKQLMLDKEKREAMHIERNIQACSRNPCCRVKAIRITHFSVCMRACVRVYICGCPTSWVYACAWAHVALLIQPPRRMRNIVLSFLATLSPPYFLISHKLNEMVTGHKMCVLLFSTTFIWNISHSKKNSERSCQKFENVFM
jgi:hypothetical protein